LRQFPADIQAALHLVLPSRSSMRGMVCPVLTGLGQRRHVPAVSFDAPTAVAVHRGVVRIRDDDLMPQVLQVLRDPLTLRRGLHENAHPRSTPEHVTEALTRGGDALVNHLPVVGHDTNLTFSLVKIDGTILDGWSPLLRLERVFAMWSGSYHVTKEASRFILLLRAPPRFDHGIREPPLREGQQPAQDGRFDQSVDWAFTFSTPAFASTTGVLSEGAAARLASSKTATLFTGANVLATRVLWPAPQPHQRFTTASSPSVNMRL
jgi:hypothetical protein